MNTVSTISAYTSVSGQAKVAIYRNGQAFHYTPTLSSLERLNGVVTQMIFRDQAKMTPFTNCIGWALTVKETR